jgi:Fe2+ or Zn2+ uptake regulation protein
MGVSCRSSEDFALTCEEIAQQVEGVASSTVYRSMTRLEEWGPVSHSHIGQRSAVYALGSPAKMPGHLVGHRCGAVVSAPAKVLRPLELRLQGQVGFLPDFAHRPTGGTCVTCQAIPTRSAVRAHS